MADLTSDKIARILLEDFDDGLAQLRGAPRIRVALQIRHLDSDGIWHPGETRDIGAKGFSARFSTRRKIEPRPQPQSETGTGARWFAVLPGQSSQPPGG